LFTFVLKKFFTFCDQNENKVSTRQSRSLAMLTRIKTIVTRSPGSLAGDTAGALAIVFVFSSMLQLPGLF